MNTFEKITTILIAGVVSAFLALFLYGYLREENQVAVGGFGVTTGGSPSASGPTDVLNISGTGTTTAGTTKFGGTHAGYSIATTTAITAIGDKYSEIEFNIYTPMASTTEAHITLQVVKSDQAQCADSGVLHGSSAWTDVVSNKTTSGAAITLNAATSTYYWVPAATRGVTIAIADVKAKCIKTFFSGASTTVWMRAKLR